MQAVLFCKIDNNYARIFKKKKTYASTMIYQSLAIWTC